MKDVVWTEEKVKRFWDIEAQLPERYFTAQIGAALVGQLGRFLVGRKRILDYGCGTGELIPHLLRLGGEVTGVDFSDNSISVASSRGTGYLNFRGAFTIERLPKREQCFDAVLAVELIEHLDDRHLKLTFDTFKTYLAEDGVLLLTTPNDEDLSLSMIHCPECEAVFHRYQHVRKWSVETLKGYLSDNGFEIIDCYAADLSVSWKRSKLGYLKNVFSAVVQPQAKKPNLVAVCKPKSN